MTPLRVMFGRDLCSYTCFRCAAVAAFKTSYTKWTLFLLSFATLLAMIIINFLFKYFFAKPKEKIPLAPGTFGWPIIGETIQFLKALHYGLVHEFVKERTKKYNSNVFKTSLFGQKIAIFSGPAANKFIFTRGNNLLIGWRPNSVQKLFPSTSFVPIEHDTKRAQNVMSYFLNSQNVDKLISTMDSISHLHLENHWKGKDEVIVYDLMKLFTFSLSIRVFMGIEDSDKILKFYEKFNVFTQGLLVVDINFPGTTFYKAMKAGNELRKEMKAIIKERRVELLENPDLSKVDVLTQVITEQDENGKYMKEVEMTDKVFGFIIGSYHTTSTTITLTMKYLKEKHEFFNEIMEEHNEISRNMMPRKVLCWDDIQKMKKTWNFVNEVLRDTPVLQGTFREVIEDDITYDGFLIPKGWKVGDTMLKADLHDGGFIKAIKVARKLSTKENQGGGATSAQYSHPQLRMNMNEISYYSYENVVLEKHQLEETVVVGVELPKFKSEKLLKDIFEGKKPNKCVNLDEAVAFEVAAR
ncbi:beta-amyrin 28-monooxygenase-like [Lycium ferocissimum]|uniref:beta-amyrin 28-monooxygenase-like n=1 Tax=Lycium ferocissimum TaxID=112874 RepID=UPI0028158315|nr:beta-amyrin 28-monooxygenase-like [Lycium ferocissimum]